MMRYRIPLHRNAIMSVGLYLALVLGVVTPVRAGDVVNVKNLITNDQAAHPALLEDAALVNAWGISRSGTSPFWVSDNGTGVTTIYRVDPVTDVPTKVTIPLTPPIDHVSIPGDGSVTGQVFNSAGAGSFHGDAFLFVSEDGTISGWQGALGGTAEVLQLSDPANIYKGSALDVTGGHGYLLSANFGTGNIDVLKGDSSAPDLAGRFVDPGIPSGFAPFNVEVIGDKVYVTYAKTNGKDDMPGAGNGFVTAFDLQGNFLGRIGTMGGLNSPWGLAIAPSSWGSIAGDLLVGNFGDGRINIFGLNSDNTGTPLGFLKDIHGNPISIEGLWGLIAGNDGNGGSSQKIYFSAGPDDESNGLFGVLNAVPEPSSVVLGLIAVGMLGARWHWRHRHRAATP